MPSCEVAARCTEAACSGVKALCLPTVSDASAAEMISRACSGVKAPCLLTVSDSLVNRAQDITSEEREKTFTDMIEPALETATRVDV